MSKKSRITNFSKKKPSFYKLTERQTTQLMKYLMFEISQEELNEAIGYTYNCPYCNSKDIYKTQSKSHLYKFKCETCKKKFTNLSKSIISNLSLEEYINRGNRFSHKDFLTNIEVWLCFDTKNRRYRRYRRYDNLERKNNLAHFSNWRYNLLQIPKVLKKETLKNIHERDEESFYRLLNTKTYNVNKRINLNNKRFIILTFEEGKYTSKQSLNSLQLMEVNNSPLKRYQDDIKRKNVLQEYKYLKDTLIKSYNIECENLNEPNIDDMIYKDIEKPYRHTYTLAFEMAIRNKEVKKIIYALSYLKDIQQGNKKLLSKYSNYLHSELHEQYLTIGILKINELIKDFEDELQKDYLIIPKENNVITPESNKVLIQRCIYNSDTPKTIRWNTKEENYKFEEQVYADYTITTGIIKGNDSFDVNMIRPTYNLNIVDNNTFHVPINFNLPIEEITAFIEKIKKDSERNNNLIKSPLELLDRELESIEPEDVEKYFPKTFEAKLSSMSYALFTYDTFYYLTNKQKQLEMKRDVFQDKLNNELSKYNKPGRKTARQEINEKKITKKYEPLIQECDKKINHIGKTVKDKHAKIGKTIGVSVTTIERYLKFMDSYIGNLKYRRLFIKTKK